MLALEYSSSEEEGKPSRASSRSPPARAMKRRKLPALGGSFFAETPDEDRSKHQGRTLARAKVIGDYPTHLFLAFDVHPSFHDLVDDARILVPELHSLIDPSPSTSSSRSSSPVPSSVLSFKKAKLKLHVSLSRPLYVRKDQRPSLEAALRDIVADTKAFQVSFSKLRVLRNDEQTRIFLGVDVAAGYPELTALTEQINVVLKRFHHPPYYENPLFHASVAWALLRPTPSLTSPLSDAPSVDFPSITDLSDDVLAKLSERHEKQISTAVGGLRVSEVQMKYGAEQLAFALKS